MRPDRPHIFFCERLYANPALKAKPMTWDGNTTAGIASWANNPINSNVTPALYSARQADSECVCGKPEQQPQQIASVKFCRF